MGMRRVVGLAVLAASLGAAAATCAPGRGAIDAPIPCPGPAALVIENTTGTTYEAWWFDQRVGSAPPGSSRLMAPTGFPCRSGGDCRGIEFRDRQGQPPHGAYRGTIEYQVECGRGR